MDWYGYGRRAQEGIERSPYGCWRGQRAFVVASGPGLTAEDCEKIQEEKVIAVNCAVRLCPFADALYAGDHKWYEAYQEDWKDFEGWKFSINPHAVREFDIIHVDRTNGILGEKEVALGGNSGYQAANLAYLFGANPIYLLGFDMRPKDGVNHFHGDHDRRGKYRLTNPNSNLYRKWVKNFSLLHAAMRDQGVELINCSRETALTIPRKSLEECLNT